MKKSVIALATSLSLTCMSSMAMSVGTVNMADVLQHSPETAKIQKTLASHFSGEQKKLQSQATKLQQALQNYEKNKAVMSKSQLKKAQADLQKQEISLQQNKQRFQQAVSTMQMQLSKKMFAHVKSAIAKVASSEKLDIVMPNTVVLYAGSKVDITSKVMSSLK